ncbi:8905_t:CDS:1, partial [Racocetra fulgida]
IWVEDANHYRIGGDGKGKYHVCDKTGEDIETIDIADQEYYVVKKYVFVYIEWEQISILIKLPVNF